MPWVASNSAKNSSASRPSPRLAAAFPFTVSTMGRLLFLRCFMKSPDERRKVVKDWMSVVMSSISASGVGTLFGAFRIARFRDGGKGEVVIFQVPGEGPGAPELNKPE